MKIPSRCKECRVKGIFPCNDCIFTSPCEEIVELFGLNTDDNFEIEEIETVLPDTS